MIFYLMLIILNVLICIHFSFGQYQNLDFINEEIVNAVNYLSLIPFKAGSIESFTGKISLIYSCDMIYNIK